MTKTTITKTTEHEVTLRADDPYSGEYTERVFWIPRGGGYIREGARHSADDKQVCAGLDRRGSTLTADSGDDLLRVIREQWQVCRRDAAKTLAL